MKKRRFDFEYVKGKASDRKGVGMELALLVLLVVFACSTLLLTTALFGRDRLQEKEQKLIQRLALDEYAEQTLAGTVPDPVRFDGYESTKADNANGFSLEITVDGVLALTVTVESGAVVGWSYH